MVTRAHGRLIAAGWLWRGEKWRGCIKEVYWQDPKTGGIVQQRAALKRLGIDPGCN